MAQIGKWNKLKVLREVDFGVYLDGEADGEILLPVRDMPDPCEVGEMVDVFVCFDSEDRLIATTQAPEATIGEFASLKVAAIERVGAFLDWGLSKDLFLPFAEQTRSLQVGQYVVVYLYLDSSDRIAASMKLERNIDSEPGDYEEGQKVRLLIAARTDLGFKAIIEGRHWGVLYENEVFSPLRIGQATEGFIKKIRDDGKIDLSLQGVGHRAADEIAPRILEMLKEKNGFLPINDKTSAETIHRLFGVSRKQYKIALGGLYKKRLITIDSEGIRLV